MALKFLNNGYFAGTVGIGTETPGAKLHTKTGSSNGAGYDNSVGLIVEGATRSIIQVNSTSDAYLMFGDAAQLNRAWVGYNHTADQLMLHTGSTITMDGNVGIGVTGPTDKLTVNGNLSIFGNKIYNGSASNSAGVSFPSSTTRIDGYNGITFHSSQTTVGSQTERMRITSAGNVGIGTTSPYAFDTTATKLHVKNTGSSGSLSEIARFKGSSDADGSGGTIRLGTSNDRGIYFEGGRTGSVPYGKIGTTEYDGTKTLAITLDNTGNAAFAGDVLVEDNLYLTDAGTVRGKIQLNASDRDDLDIKAVSLGSNMKFFTVDTERMRIDSTGNVGIGTTSPSAKLDVAGDLRIDGYSTTTNEAGLYLYNNIAYSMASLANCNSSYNAFRIRGRNSATNTLALGSNGNSDYVLQVVNDAGTASGNILINPYGGNVGIGTTRPTAGRKLDVHGDIELTEDLFIGATGSSRGEHKIKIGQNRSGNGYAYIDMIGDAGATSFYNLRIIRHNSGANALSQIVHTGTGNFEIKASDGGDIILNSSGSIGISQTSPSYKLDVNGDGRFTSTVTAANFILSSDERLKENVEKVCDNKVKADWKTFELKTEKGQKRYGVIAQELEKTNPEFVREDSQGFKSVAYIDLLIAKIAELEARLEKAGI